MENGITMNCRECKYVCRCCDSNRGLNCSGCENQYVEELENAIQRAFDRINLIGTECDVCSILYQYKAIRELPDEEIDKIYDSIIESLGF